MTKGKFSFEYLEIPISSVFFRTVIAYSLVCLEFKFLDFNWLEEISLGLERNKQLS